MSILENIRAHSQPDLVREIDVPEWKLKIFYRMVTVDDMANVQASAPNNPARQEAELLCLKAMDDKGKMLFARMDVLELVKVADPIVLHRIADAMMRRETAEQIEKN